MDQKIWKKAFVFEPPPKRYQHQMCYLGGNTKKAIMFGGYSDEIEKFFDDLWEFGYANMSFNGKALDLPGCVWKPIETMV